MFLLFMKKQGKKKIIYNFLNKNNIKLKANFIFHSNKVLVYFFNFVKK